MKKLIFKIIQNSFVKGGFYLTVSSFIVGFLNYLFNIFAARALGPSGYSEIAALFSYSIVFSVPMGAISSFIIQKIGQSNNPNQTAVFIQEMFIQKIKKWWFLLFFVILITPFIPKITNLSQLSGYLLPILLILSFLSSYYNGALQGLHIFLWLSILSIVGVLIKLAGSIIVLYNYGNITIIILMIILSGVVTLLISHFVYVKKIFSTKIKKNNNNYRIRDLLKDSQIWLTVGTTGALALVNNIDIMFTKKFFSAESAGIYSSWSLFAKMIFYALGPILTMAFIFFSTKKHELKHQIIFILTFIFLAACGVLTNLGYGLFRFSLIDKLFGNKFYGVVPFLEWAAYFGTGYTMMTFMVYYYLAKKKKLSLLPALLLPIYVIALMVFSKSISDVMFISTIYTYVNISIFLLVFFKDRFKFLIS